MAANQKWVDDRVHREFPDAAEVPDMGDDGQTAFSATGKDGSRALVVYTCSGYDYAVLRPEALAKWLAAQGG